MLYPYTNISMTGKIENSSSLPSVAEQSPSCKKKLFKEFQPQFKQYLVISDDQVKIGPNLRRNRKKRSKEKIK